MNIIHIPFWFNSHIELNYGETFDRYCWMVFFKSKLVFIADNQDEP